MADVEIEGRGREKAILLLAAARDLDLPTSVVRTTTNGYIVPEEVAKALDSKPEEKAPAKKAPAKKAAAKKTTAKKAAASKATQE